MSDNGIADPCCCGDPGIAEERPGVMYVELNGVKNTCECDPGNPDPECDRCHDCDTFNTTHTLYRLPDSVPDSCNWKVCAPGNGDCIYYSLPGHFFNASVPCGDPEEIELSIQYSQDNCYVEYEIQLSSEGGGTKSIPVGEWKGFSESVSLECDADGEGCDMSDVTTCTVWGPA